MKAVWMRRLDDVFTGYWLIRCADGMLRFPTMGIQALARRNAHTLVLVVTFSYLDKSPLCLYIVPETSTKLSEYNSRVKYAKNLSG